MFSDLTNSDSIKELGLSNTKAYPSVNSPNDGGFNSEQNLRQFIKSIATKPFIIGKTEEDVTKSFKTNPSSFGIYFDSAMFSVDGYVFKIAPQKDISYDAQYIGEPGSTFNTQYIQRFVLDLCGYGKEDSERIASKLDEFCFEEYNPGISSDWDALKESWEDVVDKDISIGYVRIAYMDSYLENVLIVDDMNNLIKYNSETIDRSVTLIDYDSSFETDGKVNPDAIKDYLEGHTMSTTKPFGCVVREDIDQNPTKINIYYPVFVKTIGTKRYITFEDIYNIQYRHDQTSIGYTKSYPSTKCLFVNIDSNPPMNSLYPDVEPENRECQFFTQPTQLYRYQDLYTVDSSHRASRHSFDTEISDIAVSIDSYLSEFFTKVSFENVKNIQSTDSSSQRVPYVKNTLSYYCLKVPDSDKLTINNSKVPISFMTSEGSLCPNGFIYSSTANAFEQSYPIEGYMHYVYRKVAEYNGTTFDQVTFEDVIDYIKDPNITDNVYTDYIAPAISVYLSLCYSSLMQYAASPAFNVTTDYKNDQSLSCGEKLSVKAASNPNVTTDDFATYYNFTYTGYNYSGTGTTYTTSTDTYKIRYNKDRTSDNWKIHDSVILEDSKNILGYDVIYTYSPIEGAGFKKYLRFDDPANFISRCNGDNAPTQNTIPFKLSFVVKNSSGNCALDNDNYILFDNVQIDEYLMPCYKMGSTPYVESNLLLANLTSLVTVSFSGTGTINDSLINSLNFRTMFNTWVACFDYVADVAKDSQGYLCGRNIDEPNIYDGLRFSAKLPQDVTNDELFLFRLGVACTGSVEAYNNETCLKYPDSTSDNAATRRQAFIHTSKIYGDDYKDFNSCVSSVVNDVLTDMDIIDIRDDVDTLSNQLDTLANTDIPDMESKIMKCQKLIYTYSTEYNTYYVYGLGDNDTNKICIVRKGSTSGAGTTDVFTDTTIADVIVTPGVERVEGSIGYNSITIPSSVNNIKIEGDTTGAYSADKLKGPKYIKMEEGLTGTILDPVVRGKVEEAIIPSTFNKNDECFNECGELKKLVVNCAAIETGFCDTCTSLDTVILSSGFQLIHSRAFYNCTGLTTLTYNGTTSGWGNVSKETDWAITSAYGEAETRITRVDCLNGYWEFSGGSWHDYTNT